MRQSVQGKIEAEVQKQLTLRQVGQPSALSSKLQRECEGAPQAATNPSAGQAARPHRPPCLCPQPHLCLWCPRQRPHQLLQPLLPPLGPHASLARVMQYFP